MQAYTRSVAEVERALSVDKNIGLTDKAYKENKAKFGENILSQKKYFREVSRILMKEKRDGGEENGECDRIIYGKRAKISVTLY